MEQKLLKTSDYIVAFIDILGAKALIKKDVDGSLNTVHRVYEKSLEIYEKIFKELIPFDITIFSDNIVIGREIVNKPLLASYFQAVHFMAAIVQESFLSQGLLVRGAIAYGSYFKDDIMVWGNALTKAYELESSAAIYPRIIVDPELVGELELFQRKELLSKLWLKQDNDGLFFIDYLQDKFIKQFDLVLLKELATFDQRIIDCGNDTRIMQKNIWQLNYIKSKITGGNANA